MRRGFTLIEVIVALALTGLVVTLASALLAGLLNANGTLVHARDATNASEVARAWLLEACHGVDVGAKGDLPFTGTDHEAGFTARLLGPDGSVAPAPVALATSPNEVLMSVPAGTFVVADSITSASFDYLVGGGGDGAFLQGWNSPASAPLAIRIIWARGGATDTLLCPIGARG